jgi:hypothetical protein
MFLEPDVEVLAGSLKQIAEEAEQELGNSESRCMTLDSQSK